MTALCVFQGAIFVAFLVRGHSALWAKGVIYYDINATDYDLNSQSVIRAAILGVEQATCIKFFSTPLDASAARGDRRQLYISNPARQRDCNLPGRYDFTPKVVTMPIGYKCMSEKAVADVIVDMLLASIQVANKSANAFAVYDSNKNAQQKAGAALVSPAQREAINRGYFHECLALEQPLHAASRGPLRAPAAPPDSQALASRSLASHNLEFYWPKLWPGGVVHYYVHPAIAKRRPDLVAALSDGMSLVSQESCVVFRPIDPARDLWPRQLIAFIDERGAKHPELGVRIYQELSLQAFVQPERQHGSHLLHHLLRVLGLPMMSNRFDRNNYLRVNWPLVAKGEERLLERESEKAWIRWQEYDFDSVTHAPSNFLCDGCPVGAATVRPIQDRMWSKEITMGHRSNLSAGDIEFINLLYRCRSVQQKYQLYSQANPALAAAGADGGADGGSADSGRDSDSDDSDNNIQNNEKRLHAGASGDQSSESNAQKDDSSAAYVPTDQASFTNAEKGKSSDTNAQTDQSSESNAQKDDSSAAYGPTDQASFTNGQKGKSSDTNAQTDQSSESNAQKDDSSAAYGPTDQASFTNGQKGKSSDTNAQTDQSSESNAQKDDISAAYVPTDQASFTNAEKGKSSGTYAQTDQSSESNAQTEWAMAG